MKITLKQLQIFSAIAKHENISLAADEIALTQSAMSMALKELESQLNAPLFHRQGKRLKLNNMGINLQPKVVQLLKLAEEIEQITSQDKLTGRIRIGASSTIGNYLAPAIIAEFTRAFPEVHIDLKIGNTENIIDDMHHMRIDLGLIEGLCDSPKLDIIPWRKDDLIIFCGTRHPLAKAKSIDFDTLANTPWILREQGSGTRAIFTSATHQHFQPRDQLLEFGNSEAIKQAVKTGYGISCLSELALASELKHKEVRALDIQGLDLQRQLLIIKHKSGIDNHLQRAFEAKLLEHNNA